MDQAIWRLGVTIGDLYEPAGLARLDGEFLAHVAGVDPALGLALVAARRAPEVLALKDESALLIALAPHVEDFIAGLFRIEAEAAALAARHQTLAPLYRCKRLFVQRRAARAHKPETAAGFDGEAIEAALVPLLGGPLEELRFAISVVAWLDDEAANGPALDLAERYAAWALHASAGKRKHRPGVLFKQPHKVEPLALVPVEAQTVAGVACLGLGPDKARHREGFALTDPGTDLVGALDQVTYCIFCHNQGKDSCARGLVDRKAGGFQKSPFGVVLAGCPLDQKISEVHVAKGDGHSIGALAIIIVDNPMVAATGHRICNDCMKACIYQRQDPVDIPQAETRILKDVLELPWGFEIYGLLTRWNPLNVRRPLPLAPTGRSVLVVGLGPAGFTLAHHLMNDGHAVVAIDGLKIEPLPERVSGVAADGGHVAFEPVRDVEALYESMDDRVMAGFGGVAEYGITARWNKNFLKLVRLLLERRRHFIMLGGVRFGGTLTIAESFAMGFDHVALCNGAGRPTEVAMANRLAPGVRMASDFLMALQLTGAAKRESVANLQVRLPVVVIGGGLTGIDTATEALAYYPVQVEKFLERYEKLAAERGAARVRASWSPAEAEAADEFIAHAKAIRAERARATSAGRPPALRALLDSWGGAMLAYRRRLIDSPSYTLNHEEVAKALEEGIRFAECLAPVAVEVDAFGRAQGLTLRRTLSNEAGAEGDLVTLPARTVLVAAGTQPNTVLAREDGSLKLDGRYFQAVDEAGLPVTPERIVKPKTSHVLMSIEADGRAISFFGDLHPTYAGNVVKAMAGAKQGYPVVSRLLARYHARASARELMARMNGDFRAFVDRVERLTPTIVEVVLRAPAAARAFKPGQFFRLQNYEARARRVGGTLLAMEGLAMTGAWVDAERGLVSLIVLEMGGSSDLTALLEPGEPVVLMGPTGSPSEIPAGQTVLLAGGGLGNAVLFSIGRAMREAGCRVIYFAGYKQAADRFKVRNIEAAADLIVWCSDTRPGFTPGRPQDLAFVGNIVDAMAAYATGALGPAPVPFGEVDHLLAIGSDRMMAAVAKARHGVLAAYLKPGHVAIGSINSPMQCMMKEVCAQCLQLHRDPATGEERIVYSCFNQDQALDRVDFTVLAQRLAQNGTQEKLTALWIDRCLRQIGAR
ncbi:MAG: pyridine nucleotide-disulfide oxidoreductase [Alphaproteobacteria bacterium]|nr:pyridine nucleotide-disulfide oxidoreductase [Alphaproteobacteria bacterium]